eukprot:356994-Chlamydomonas_euryale.AAC.1
MSARRGSRNAAVVRRRGACGLPKLRSSAAFRADPAGCLCRGCLVSGPSVAIAVRTAYAACAGPLPRHCSTVAAAHACARTRTAAATGREHRRLCELSAHRPADVARLRTPHWRGRRRVEAVEVYRGRHSVRWEWPGAEREWGGRWAEGVCGQVQRGAGTAFAKG